MDAIYPLRALQGVVIKRYSRFRSPNHSLHLIHSLVRNRTRDTQSHVSAVYSLKPLTQRNFYFVLACLRHDVGNGIY